RCRHVNFVTRSPRETRAFGRANIRRRSLLRIQVRVARSEKEIGNRRCAQLGLDSLGLGGTEVERFKKSVEPDDVGQIVVKIRRTDSYAPVPKPLLNSCVPAEILFRLQGRQRLAWKWIESKDLVLTARRTETGRNA